eukprot:9998_1
MSKQPKTFLESLSDQELSDLVSLASTEHPSAPSSQDTEERRNLTKSLKPYAESDILSDSKLCHLSSSPPPVATTASHVAFLQLKVAELIRDKESCELTISELKSNVDQLENIIKLKDEEFRSTPKESTQKMWELQHRVEVEVRAQFADIQKLSARLHTAQSSNERTATGRRSRARSSERTLARLKARLGGAVRRINWLLDEKKQLSTKLSQKESYITKLEEKFLQQHKTIKKLRRTV